MRLCSTCEHAAASRPVAYTWKSVAGDASTSRYNATASAAASKAAPRLAELAGSFNLIVPKTRPYSPFPADSRMGRTASTVPSSTIGGRRCGSVIDSAFGSFNSSP